MILDEKDRDLLKDKKAVIIDDVISTGSTLQGMRMILEKAGATVAAEIADLDPETYGRKTIAIELTSTEQLIIDLLGTARRIGIDLSGMRMRPSALQAIAGKIEGVVAPLMQFDDPKGIYAHCLCEFD